MTDPKSIEDYESSLGEAIEKWPPEMRVALAAGQAERWLPVYETFSKAEEWGDHANLRRILDAVWGHAQGKKLSGSDIRRYKGELEQSTPHMDDFDAPEALAACMVLSDALESCKSDDNVFAAVRASLSGFEAAVPDMVYDDEADVSRLWKKTAAKRELKKQQQVAEKIAALSALDDATVKALRKELASKALAGEASPPAEKAVPSGASNREVFDYYRKRMESSLRSPFQMDDSGSEYIFGTVIYAQWASRYIMRRRTLTGNDFPVLADTFAHDALVARNRALDAAETQLPGWTGDTKEVIDLCLQNPMSEAEIRSVEAVHSYGPSLRLLWGQGKRAGKDDMACWQHIVDWARHKPEGWAEDDKRRKKGLAHEKELGAYLDKQVSWAPSGDPFFPWKAAVDGKSWQVRLNDYPEALMYTLVIDGAENGSFHDWPAAWQR